MNAMNDLDMRSFGGVVTKTQMLGVYVRMRAGELETVNTDSSLEDICCKEEQGSQAVAGRGYEVKRNGRSSSIFLCAHGSSAQYHPLLPPPLQWLSRCFLTYTLAFYSLYSKYSPSVILLNHKPNNDLLSSHHT